MDISSQMLCDFEAVALAQYPHIIVAKPNIAFMHTLYYRLGEYGPWPFKPDPADYNQSPHFREWALPCNKERLFNIAIGGDTYDAIINLKVTEHVINKYFGGTIDPTTINTPWLNAPGFLNEVGGWIGIPSQQSVFLGFFTNNNNGLIDQVTDIALNNELITYKILK